MSRYLERLASLCCAMLLAVSAVHGEGRATFEQAMKQMEEMIQDAPVTVCSRNTSWARPNKK